MTEPFYSHGGIRLYQGDCRKLLAEMPAESVHCVVTSPPYWNLRDYKCEGQIGHEPTASAYIATLVDVFRQVRRVLRADGTLWLVLGDSYARSGGAQGGGNRAMLHLDGKQRRMTSLSAAEGLREKQLLMLPARVALALQADGWWLRQHMPWVKRNAMSESATDRPHTSVEEVFLFSRSERYYFDMEAVKQQLGLGRSWRSGDALIFDIPVEPFHGSHFAVYPTALVSPMIAAGSSERGVCPRCLAPHKRVIERISSQRNTVRGSNGQQEFRPGASHTLRSNIVMPPSYNGSTFTNGKTGATHANTGQGPRYETRDTGRWVPGCKCDAGEPIPATVADPFSGAGTTLLVAKRLGRHGVGLELSPEYCRMAAERLGSEVPWYQEPPASSVGNLGPLFEALA